MGIRNMGIVVYCTMVAVAILYEHQALLPLLAEQWQRSAAEVSLLTTVTMAPLAIAPLLYGYVLEHLSAKRLLIAGLSVLTIVQFILAQGADYYLFLFLRAIEGLMLPAILTALMTYSSSAGGQEKARRNITIYIAATIIGGFSGRLLSGVIADWFNWQMAFWLWSILAAIALLSTHWLASDPRTDLGRVNFSEIRRLLQKPIYREGFISAFLLFFIFAAMMNFLPFHMQEIKPSISQSAIAMVYMGYLIGVVAALSSLHLIHLFGSEKRTLIAGCIIYLAGTLLFILPSLPVIYLAMFVFAGGMFVLHSVLSAYLNHLESKRKGLINGLYVSSYYLGGACGSFLPGLVYQQYGWQAFMFTLLALLVLLGGIITILPDTQYE